MKIVFLDFDGVLVNHRSWYVRDRGHRATGDPPCVAALNRITEETGAQIVVSSTWRLGTPVAELRGILKSWGVTAPVIDKTPTITERDGVILVSRPRGAEIQKWIDRGWREPIESFVILDDDDDMEHLKPYLIQTEFEAGLTMEHATKAISVLSGQSGEAQSPPSLMADRAADLGERSKT